MFEIELPYPPSVNHVYLRSANKRMYKDAKATRYQDDVRLLLLQAKAPLLKGKLAVMIEVYPPDLRKRDLDNIFKISLDSLARGGLMSDDSQICWIGAQRMETLDGKLIVRVKEI